MIQREMKSMKEVASKKRSEQGGKQLRKQNKINNLTP